MTWENINTWHTRCSYTEDTSYYQQKQDQTRGTAETMQDGTMVVALHLFPGCEPSSKLFFCFGSPKYVMYCVGVFLGFFF